ncbi:hypothetical protein [Candidatus Methylacidithermus pantelleriae]|uniref:hypothetical protein n=1 Tax=Candidatus Methylacidithermus pantelleriae TaxID=2744239 RepID=UPI001BD482B3|nr:hypothetical protein [Candidatus Methylacidithermus pantelleriae]
MNRRGRDQASLGFIARPVRTEDQSRVVLARIGWVRTYEPATVLWQRIRPGMIGLFRATVNRMGGRWVTSFSSERESKLDLPRFFRSLG